MPWRSMPNSGTATITHSASAAVVESEPVGGSKPGMMVPRLALATNRKSVPKKPMYLRGWLRPTSSICCSIPVTTISSRFCQRERVRSVESLRVMSLEPTARNSIKPHVKTMVPLSFKNPCCQKIISSGLRRMANLLGQPCHDLARHDKTQQARQPALPIATRRNIKHGQRPGAASWIALIQPKTKRRAQQGRHRYRPADHPHHPQTKPHAGCGIALCLELAPRFDTDLHGQVRLGFCRFFRHINHGVQPC